MQEKSGAVSFLLCYISCAVKNVWRMHSMAAHRGTAGCRDHLGAEFQDLGEQQPSGRAFDSPKLEAFSRPRSEGGLHRAPLAPHPAFWRLTGIHPLAFGTLESTAGFLLMKRATALTPRMTQGQSLLSACSVPTFRCRCLSSIAPGSSALCATYELRPANASFGDQVAISTARSLARWASTSEQSQAACIAPRSTTCERALRQAQCHR